MGPSVETQLDAVVRDALPVQTCACPARTQGVDRALLQDPGPLTLLGIGAVTAFQDDAVDAVPVQQTGQEQARRARPHYADTGTTGEG